MSGAGDEFVSEEIRPIGGAGDAGGMVRGEPGLPGRFVWRDKEYVVEEVLKQWKESGRCKGGSSEMYLRKHWFKIRCVGGLEMTIYFERQARSKRENKKRWWLYTVGGGEETLG